MSKQNANVTRIIDCRLRDGYHVPMPDDKDKAGKKNNRIHPRVDFFSRVKVTVPDDSTAIDVFAGNVSTGGMFLRSNRPLEKGSKVGLEFDINNKPVKVDVGEVVWNKPFEPISIDGSPSGMGIEFRSLASDSRQQIESFISEALGEQDQQGLEDSPEPSAPPVSMASDSEAIDQSAPPKPEAQAAASQVTGARMKLDILQPGASDARIPETAAGPEQFGPTSMEEEKQMAQLSQPPPPKKRAFLFIGFVLLVAVVTFFVLLIIKPFGKTGQKPPAKIALTTVDAGVKEAVAEDAGVQKPAGAADQKIAAAAADAKETSGTKPDEKQPAEPKKDTKKEAVKNQPQKNKNEPEKSATGTVDLPVFSKSAEGFRMTLRTGAPVDEKHFTLKDPPRLAIDLKAVQYTGQTRTLEKPAPFISRVRIGQQEGFTRFVLDFNGEKVPVFKLVKGKDGLTVIFGK
jgi:uncharacterized protein (TIGR02266 family)